MHDPNRARDRGDPNVDASQPAAGWNPVTPDDRSGTEDADPAATAWTGSNPGLTGDTPSDTGTTAEAGSGADEAKRADHPLGRMED